MRIESLYLKNFRGFRDLKINFPHPEAKDIFDDYKDKDELRQVLLKEQGFDISPQFIRGRV